MSTEASALQQARSNYHPKLPGVFADGARAHALDGKPIEPARDGDRLKDLFPNTFGLPATTFAPGAPAEPCAIRAGVILSGGQAPGGHNVIAGLFDGLKALNPENVLFGFLGGPGGLVKNLRKEITAEFLATYRNTGGFDIIGSGRTKLEEKAQFDQALENCRALGINALVIVGGDDSNTNACVLAEYYRSLDAGINVIGCPKTIDGDMKNQFIGTSFGFDTATKVYSELVGNILRDANSAKKYYHFVKLMGRSASHIALECALQTRPNACLVGEEIAARNLSLSDVVEQLAGIVVRRAEAGKDFGVFLIPEGVIEFMPDMQRLIGELNEILAENADFLRDLPSQDDRRQFLFQKLSAEAGKSFSVLPQAIQLQLILDRDSHGNVQVSRIETEKLLADIVGDRLRELKARGEYKGLFSAQCHFFGYEGRCAAPSNFDADYCYSLGYTAAALLGANKTGYIATVQGLDRPAAEWAPGGIPLTAMMNIERRHGADKPVIKKALVDLEGKPFGELAANREDWAINDRYLYPGPVQYFGPPEVCDQPTRTLLLEQS
ncbi:MAG: diphosphate--fructose-6-phosphate 1-phosphotransferase [Verrucomicrobiales bacterium]|nr:diphosphate--fructose-6-phosphate 1-phosphotransferase [Verrucomicrobiales bacterium]